jgi:predicted Zn-dependent peptidase
MSLGLLRTVPATLALALLASCSAKSDTAAATASAADRPGESALVWPDEAFRYEQPEAGPAVEVEIPEIATFTLASGVDVYLVERHELPVVSMTLRFPVGSVADPRGKEGLADIATSLLDEGTKELDKAAFEARLADLASNVYAGASDEESYVGMRSLGRSLEPTLDLMFEMLESPGLRAEDLERLRDSAKASLEQRKAAPAGIGRRLWPSVVYGPKHPYGKIRTKKSYDAIKLADCRRFVGRFGTRGARLFVVGDITRAQIETVVEPGVARLGRKRPRNPKVGAPRPRRGTVFFVDVPDAPQSQLYVGHPGPLRTAEDYEATQLMATILGGGFSSRINMNIREDKGFSYGARAGFSYEKHAGAFRASSSVHAETTGAALREIAKEIQTMRTTDVTPEELEREQNGILLGMPARFATGRGVLGSFSTLVFFGLPLDYYEGYQQRIRATTIPKVRKAAETHLRASGFKVLVVGDGAKVRDELQAIADEGLFGSEGLVELDADGVPVRGEKGG